MAIIKLKCDCGKLIKSNVGDSIIESRLRWYQSYHCDSCGNTIEMDGVDIIPPEIKAAIMTQEGSYGLYLNDLKDRVKTVYLLKKIPHFDLKIFNSFIEKKSDLIVHGTKNEVLLIKNFLEEKGIYCGINDY